MAKSVKTRDQEVERLNALERRLRRRFNKEQVLAGIKNRYLLKCQAKIAQAGDKVLLHADDLDMALIQWQADRNDAQLRDRLAQIVENLERFGENLAGWEPSS
jgi:hypothetical protein